MLGEPPQNTHTRPADKLQSQDGPFGKGRLVLNFNPVRIDWFYQSGKEALLLEELPFLGGFPEDGKVFFALMQKWLGICPPIRRMAFGAVLMELGADRVAVNKKLASYLPNVSLDTENSNDFFYQINRPTKSGSKISGLEINRLAKWSSVALIVGGIKIGPEGITQDQISPAAKMVHLCQLELDINTSLDYKKAITKSRTKQVFNELLSIGQKLAENGDEKLK